MSRPRKRVVVAARSAMTRSVVRMVLESRGYAVNAAPRECRFWEWLPGAHAYVLIGYSERVVARIARRAHGAWPEIRDIAVRARGEIPEGEWIAMLLDRVRLAVQRKRGPKYHGRSDGDEGSVAA